MAHSSECTDQCAQRVLDAADIVREAMLRQLSTSPQSPATAVTPAESRAMLLYNGSRVHNAKYELVGGLASATGLFVWFLFWFLFWFKNDPGASLDTWR
jgi:hypothetical protein